MIECFRVRHAGDAIRRAQLGNGRGYPSAPTPVDKRAASPRMAGARLSTGPAQPAGCGEPRKIPEVSACQTRNVVVFGHTKPKTATKFSLSIDVLQFLTTVYCVVVENCIVLVVTKPKTATFPDALPFLATPAGVRLESLPKSASSVAEKGSVAVFDLASLPFLATIDLGNRWRIVGDAGIWLAARYNCVLRAYGAPFAVALALRGWRDASLPRLVKFGGRDGGC